MIVMVMVTTNKLFSSGRLLLCNIHMYHRNKASGEQEARRQGEEDGEVKQ